MNKGGPVPTTAAGAATLRALEQQRAVVAHLTRKANGEMARVARPACLNGAWLFAQKNRAVVANSDADLKAALDKLGNNVAHAVEFGRSFFRLLRTPCCTSGATAGSPATSQGRRWRRTTQR